MAPVICQIAAIILLINVDPAFTYIQACFFKSDSRLRNNEAAFSVQDIDFTLCTHYIYGYAKVDAERQTLMAADRNAEEGVHGLYSKFNSGKVHNPLVRTILSLDGDDAAFVALRDRDPTFQYFPVHVLAFLRGRGFDGLDIHWEITRFDTSKIILPKMLQALRNMFDKDRRSSKLLLTISGYGNPASVQEAYDGQQISQYLDYVFVQSQDLVSENIASFLGPFVSNPRMYSRRNMQQSITFWKQIGVPANKLVMSVTALGHYVRLQDWRDTRPGAPATTEVLRGPVYNISGRLVYPEICALMDSSQRYFNNTQKSAYLVHGDEWVGYIDTVSLDARIYFMNEWGLAGLYFMNLDEDDFSGTACNAGRFPLITYLRNKLDPVRPTAAPPETSTVMIDTTSEAQTDDNIDLITPVKNAPTTKSTIIEQTEMEEGSFTVIDCIIMIFAFINGCYLGYVMSILI